MMFRVEGERVLAISQPAHAWISGQLTREWAGPASETLCLAAEQHDIAWLDWEVEPSFDPSTGRPHGFRDVPPVTHAPMWIRGVERALAAWGPHVALLVARHGALIYRRFVMPRPLSEADAAAARHFFSIQEAQEAAWILARGLDPAELNRQTRWIAAADALSLAICGDLRTPVDLEIPSANGEFFARLSAVPGRPYEFTLSPWPFRAGAIVIEGEGRALPPEGRLADEAAMRAWLADPRREPFRARLSAA